MSSVFGSAIWVKFMQLKDSETEGNESITISEDDRLLVNACNDYEKSQSQINLGGILQGTNVQNVNININGNKH